MAIKEKNFMMTQKDGQGNITILRPYTSIQNVKNGVARVDGIIPDDSGNVKLRVIRDYAIDAMLDEVFS